MRTTPVVALLLSAAALAGCQTEPPARTGGGGGKSAALRSMEQVATAAYRCWFTAKDPAFSRYSFANELNSMTGRPRFLLVPKGNFGGKPLLVVQAEGPAGRVTAFGPMLDGPLAPRINGDVSRWAAGDNSCTAGA